MKSIWSICLVAACLALISVSALAIAADEKPKTATVKSDPYPLETCPVSGGKLGSMGKPVVKEYDGREVRFCCGDCIKPFEAKKAEMLKKIDAKIIEQQIKHYPLTHCVVMEDDSLDAEGGKPVSMVYANRLVRFCCNDCVSDFKKEPATYLAKIDAAVIKEQKDAYPLDTDVVTGAKLGEKPIDKVYGVMLVRFANEESVAKYVADPLTYNAKIKAAWAAKHPEHEKPKDGPKKEEGHDGHDHKH